MQDFITYNGLLSKLSKKDLNELFIELKKYKLSAQKKLNIPETLSYGIEIEFEQLLLKQIMEHMQDIKEFKYWLVHGEPSVHRVVNGEILGGEISSYVLHNTKQDWQKIFKIYRILNKLGAENTNRCGLHIHIGAHIFGDDLENFKRFIKVWCIFEDIIFRFGYHESDQPRSIENMTIFCPPLAPKYKKIITYDPKYIKDACTQSEFNFGKRNAVAFSNYHYLTSEEEFNNTIEVRCPNGTLNPLNVQNCINFFLKLCLYVTSEYYDDKLINRLFKKIGSKSFAEYSNLDLKKACILSDLIFQDGLDKINFLRGYIKDSDYMVR